MSIAENIARIEAKVTAACRTAGRPRESVRLMAVSKTHPVEAILEARAAGLHIFGENRVQEFSAKKAALDDAGIFSGAMPATFHCIGPIQSNKATWAAELFDAVDSVDSTRLAERLDNAAKAAGKRLNICIEVKLSAEETKHGLVPDSAELNELLEKLPDLSSLHPCGLMTVPPFLKDPEQVRPYFRQLRQVRDTLARQHPRLKLDELSMGMSHDFSVAIEEGATTVRVGTAIFGARPQP